MDISLTPGMNCALKNLKEISRQVDRTQERLSSGKRVHSPLDDPTNYFIATSLLDAANDIDLLQDRLSEGVQTIRAASNGLEKITSLVNSMEGIVDAAAMTSDPGAKIDLAKAFDEVYAQLNYLVRDSGYAGFNLISDSDSDPLTVTSSDLNIPLNAQASSQYVISGRFMGAGYVMHEVPGDFPAWVPDDHGGYLTQYGSSTTSVGNLSDVSLVIRFNPQVDSAGDVNGDGVLSAGEGTEIDFRLTNSGSATANLVGFSNATISTGWGFAFNTSAALGNVAAGQTVITDTSSDLDLNIPAGTDGMQFSINLDFTSDGVTRNLTFGPLTVGSITNGQVLTGGAVATTNPTVQTDTLTVNSADYENGVFDVRFPGPPVVDKTLYAEKQGLPIYHSWVYNQFQTGEGINAAKADLHAATTILRNYASELGSGSGVVTIRAGFNGELSNIYRAGAENLTLADLNEEAANMLMLQTRQQLSVSTLSLAGEASRSVLKILG